MLRVRSPPLPFPQPPPRHSPREEIVETISSIPSDRDSPRGSPLLPRSGEVEKSSFTLVRRLGGGSAGEVYLGEMDGREVAVKIVANNDYAMHELAVLNKLPRHPNVVEMLGYRIQPDRVYIVLEYVEGLRLDKWIAESDAHTLHVLLQLAEAVRHLHTFGVVHRDIKPENAVLQRDGRVVLIDFDLACDIDSADPNSVCSLEGARGTPLYIAPELWRKGGIRSPEQLLAVDMFAFGVSAYQIVEADMPFASGDFQGDVEDVRDEIVASAPRPMRNKLWERFVLPLLSKDPAFRPNAEQVVQTLQDAKRPAAPTDPTAV